MFQVNMHKILVYDESPIFSQMEVKGDIIECL